MKDEWKDERQVEKPAEKLPPVPAPAESDTSMAAALKRLADIAEAQAGLSQATAKRLAPKSLDVGEVSQISAFNLRGERTFPMPRLKCEIHAPMKAEPNSHPFTREEVELFNLLEPGIYQVELNDGEMATMTVEGARNTVTGAIERLLLKPTPPWNGEHQQRFRPMTAMLREMIGAPAGAVLTTAAERALIAAGTLAVSVNG